MSGGGLWGFWLDGARIWWRMVVVCMRASEGQSCGPSAGSVDRHLSRNKLFGSIPVELGQLTALLGL